MRKVHVLLQSQRRWLNLSIIIFIDGLCVQDQESDGAKVFLEVAASVDSVKFGVTSEEALFSENKVEKDSVVLFKQFDEKRADLTEDITVDSVTEFVKANQLPLLVYFTQEVRLY